MSIAYQYSIFILIIFFLYSSVYIFFLHSFAGYYKDRLMIKIDNGIKSLAAYNLNQTLISTTNLISFYFATLNVLI